DNWTQFMAHAQTTDLGQVWRINGRDFPETRDEIKDSNQPTLQRCRRLKSLWAGTITKGAFKWAVQEKKDLESLNSSSNNNDTTNFLVRNRHGRLLQGTSRLPAAHRQHGLVPREMLYLTNIRVAITDNIDHIVFAFNQTLQRLFFYVRTPSSTIRSESVCFRAE
ncbi:hypothetical protein BGZ47_010093, partial [Haplosporangium gracile]